MLFKSTHKFADRPNANGLFPCLPGIEVIKNMSNDLLIQIRDLVSATKEIYQDIYLSTLYRFAEFFQSMPTSENDEIYSLLTQQLKLVVAALKLRQGLVLPVYAGAETIAKEDPQWTYAIFSASLLYQLHHIQQDRKILLYKTQEESLGYWHPLMGGLYQSGTYFSIQWQSSFGCISPSTLMTMITARIISPQCLRWLAQNTLLLSNWWPVVTSDLSRANGDKTDSILNIIHKATAEIGYPVIEMGSASCETNFSQGEHNSEEPIQSVQEKQSSVDPLFTLLAYLDRKQASNERDIPWLRVANGLFICGTLLNEYLMLSEKGKTREDFIELIKPALFSKDGQYYFRYRPTDYTDRRILEGIIILEDHLTEAWQQQSINEEFQLAFIP